MPRQPKPGPNYQPPSQKILDYLEDSDLLEILPYLDYKQRKELDQLLIGRDPVLWLERHFLIPAPRDPLTGELLAEVGPIKIAPYQARLLREALRRDEDGNFFYSTILWSDVKKSGKTTIAAGVVLYMAYITPDAECYCAANDGSQSRDKLYAKIRKCVELSKRHSGIFANAAVTKDQITLNNGSFIRAIACDPSGEAGGEPTISAFSELHGYRQKHKSRLWAEMTVPPTLWGRAIRWAESYAGYEGEDSILEQLYDQHVKNGTPHPGFKDLTHDGEPCTFASRNTFAFWRREGRHAWHIPEYYAEEEENLPNNEYRRMHKNEWVSPEETFIQPEWWEACRETLPPMPDDEPIILGVDAGVSDDCFFIAGVSRHPDLDKYDDHVAVRLAKKWQVKPGYKIDYQGTEDDPGPERYLRWAIENFNVIQLCYDSYQLHDMMLRLKREGIVWVSEFSQGAERLEADADLRRHIIHKRIAHTGQHTDLTEHVLNAMAKTDSEEGRLRIIKPSKKRKVDGAVALSMATYRCLLYNW